MRYSTSVKIFLIAILAMTTTSCYTQLQTTYDEPSYYPGGTPHAEADRVSSGERSLEERSTEVVNEEDYTLGYEDGWTDAESYYFKDYEAQRWYENYGASLAHDPYARRVIVNNYYHGWGDFYSPYYSHYYPHYHPHSYWSSRWHFSIGFHMGWGHWYPRHHGYYSYYAYPGYYPYYGGYWGWGGYGYPYYGGIIVVKDGTKGRNYGPRNTGLISRGSDTIRRTRSDARIGNTVNRRAVRSEARSAQVSRSRGTINRSNSGTNRSRSSSTVRSRSGNSSNSRGTVNRGSSSNRSRGSSGTINRSGSSSGSRGNGTVNRSRSSSSSRSNGTVNRSRSSSDNRSNGTVNRSRSSNSSRSGNIDSNGVVITRGNSIIRHRASDGTRRSVLDRRTESDPNTRVNRSSSVNNRVQDYNNRSAQNGVTNQRPASRRERSIQSLRSRLLDRGEVEAPERYNNRVNSSKSSRIGFFNSDAVKQVYKHVINSGGSGSRSSGRSSSVGRSSSQSSSRSTVRSGSRSSSSSKSRSSSSGRSRSSSRDRN